MSAEWIIYELLLAVVALVRLNSISVGLKTTDGSVEQALPRRLPHRRHVEASLLHVSDLCAREPVENEFGFD